VSLAPPPFRIQERPFLTGGSSIVAYGREAEGLLNVGRGADRWSTPQAGVRVEVRDQLVVGPSVFESVLLGFRVGVVFR
jgi:hypothetical protein